MKKLKILSIDDSKAVHSFLKICVQDYAEVFDTAVHGKDGIEKLKDKKDYYDIIFLDWEMPEMTGPETFIEMKKMGIKTPVFMLTSKNDPDDIGKMLEEGVVDYLLKPFTPDIIIEKLKMNLNL